MNKMEYYCTYGDYSFVLNKGTKEFSVFHKSKPIVERAFIDGIYLNEEKVMGSDGFNDVTVARSKETEYNSLDVTFKSDKAPDITMRVKAGNKNVEIFLLEVKFYTVRIKGFIVNGKSCESFAISTGAPTEDIRSAIGKAASIIDNAVYNKSDDTAVSIDNCYDLRLKYDYDKELYGFTINISDHGYLEKIHISKKENLLSEKFNIDFVPMKERSGYKVPPSGWMTWYAVKFDACEKNVLENVEFQNKHLKKFGADTIWIDWEWYHKRRESRRSDGVDTFNPDPVKYPNGLGYIAKKIKEAGFKPALWMGFTNDLSDNEYTKENPEIILAEVESWCGTYFYDFSHPKYLDEFLPKAIGNVKKWGYEVVKYDTLPIAMNMHENYHRNMYNPTLTTKEAYRNMVKRTRELLGDDVYMLSCAALSDSDVLWGAGYFDAARVGNDVFLWEEFINQCINKVRRYYPIHNIVLYNDPDNIVLRDEFNTYDQAVSRASFVSLLGLPETFGDNLPELQEERLDLLKRILPVLDIHPMSVTGTLSGGETQIVNLSIELPFERYSVADIMNLTDKEIKRKIDFSGTLHLDEGEYLVNDYFRDEFLGIYNGGISLDLKPFESRVLSIRKKTGRPQLISTSRHITQGAAEIKNLLWDEKSDTLTLLSDLVSEDKYTVTLYIPDGYTYKDSEFSSCDIDKNIAKLSFLPEQSKKYEFNINFSKGAPGLLLA